MKPRWTLKSIITMGLFCAISVILGTVLAIKVIPLTGVYTLNLSLNLLPVHLAGMFFGPGAGFIVGFASDFIKWSIAPTGMYHPGFGFSMGMMGFTSSFVAMFLSRKKVMFSWEPDESWLNSLKYIYIIPGVAMAQLCFSVMLNSFWIASMSHVDIRVLLPTRIVNAAFMIPIYSVLVRETARYTRRILGGRHTANTAV